MKIIWSARSSHRVAALLAALVFRCSAQDEAPAGEPDAARVEGLDASSPDASPPADAAPAP
ncbi:hypothetical protein KJ940_15460, partial [Myxococcota bacterium]|nr:hypothetical protein [Myxococcota bacterium]